MSFILPKHLPADTNPKTRKTRRANYPEIYPTRNAKAEIPKHLEHDKNKVSLHFQFDKTGSVKKDNY